MIPSDLMPFWLTLGRPLTRLLFAMCIGLLIANIVEALRWTQPLARLSAPLVRLARLREAAGASFSMAFFSPAAANALLSDSHAKGEISLRELVLANLFNSLPAYMVHLPTMLFMLWPVLGAPALIYTGLTLAAAALRTLFTVGLGHFLLPPLHGENCIECRLPQEKVTLKSAALKAWKRFRRRLPKLVMFTIPVYVAMYLMQHYGLFRTAEAWLSDHTPWLGFIRPEALGIVLLSLAAEIGASLSAAGSALHMGGLTPPGSHHRPARRQHPLHPHADRPSPVPGLCRVLQPRPGLQAHLLQSAPEDHHHDRRDMGLLAMRHRLRDPLPRLLQGLRKHKSSPYPDAPPQAAPLPKI